MKELYKQLFEPFTFPCGVEIDNRIIMAPMATKSSFENGMVTLDELAYYKRRTEGLGMVITSATRIEKHGSSPGSISIATDKHIQSLSKLANTIKSNGTKAILQIFHVGRMQNSEFSGGIQPVSASAIPAKREGSETPRALEHFEIQDMINTFGEAARRAVEAGFDGVEIHGANTYLIQQFFSPLSNQRTDFWGGSLENRAKFPLAVVEAVQKAVQKHADRPFIIGYRISPEEVYEPGISLNDTLYLLNKLKKTELDYIHLSLESYDQTSLREKNQSTPTLKVISDEIGQEIPVIGVGKVKAPEDALKIMNYGTPLVSIGRELLIEPDWIKKVLLGKESEIRNVILQSEREDLCIPDFMWEYIQSRPGWVPIKDN
ncbi:NADH-dependent flavin oxidoreductase [Peribacillus simplex]|uniref:NADH-dependent flavin oxidoreductase n=1 Tax=Peribacillus simplex TaxID=1478 RepID=UPI003D29E86A